MRKGWVLGIVAVAVVAIVAAGGYYLFFQNNVQAQVEAQVRRIFANPPPPYTKATYQKLDVALATRRLTIDGIVLERSAPPYMIKIARAEATGIDIDQLQALFDPAKYKDSAPDQTFHAIADTLSLSKIDSDSHDAGRTNIDQFTAKGIQAHQFATKPDPATLGALSERDRLLIFVNAVHVDSLTYDNLTIANPKSATGVANRIELTDFSRQHVGSLAIDGLDVKNPDGTHTSWKRFELRDIPADLWFDYAISGKPPADVLKLVDFGGMKVVGLAVEPTKDDDPTVRIASLEIGKVTRQKLASFTVAGIEVNNPAKPSEGVTIGTIEINGVDWEQILPLIGNSDVIGGLRDIRYNVDKFSIRDIGGSSFDMLGASLHEISFSGGANPDTGKETSTASISGFEIDAAKVKNQEAAGFLKAMGYDHVSLSMETAGVGDRKAGTTSLDKLRIFGPNVGELTLNFALSDYRRPPGGSSPSLEEALAPLIAAKLQSLKLSWRDDSLTERLLKFASAQNGATPEQLRDGLVAQIKQFGAAYQDAPTVAAAVQAIVDYLNKPGTLVIDAKPPQPPRLGEVGSLLGNSDPSSVPNIFKQLGISVTAN